MSAPREALFARLFAIVEGLVAAADADLSAEFPLRTASRALVGWSDVGHAQCPAAFLTAAGETHTTRRGLPSMVRINTQIIVYAKNLAGRKTVPSTQLNALLSALETSLQRQPAEGPAPSALFPEIQSFGTTLGGLCYTCAIGEQVEIFEGFQGVDCAALIPVYMLTTDRP